MDKTGIARSIDPESESFHYHVRPIFSTDLDTVCDKCWDSRDVRMALISHQGILGFGAWDDDERCIAQLHSYLVKLPDWDNSLFPGYARNRMEDCPLGWPLLAARENQLKYEGDVLVLSCFHVGLLYGTFDEDPRYFRKGIGSALLGAAITWAEGRPVSAILAHGGTDVLNSYNIWMGCLPWHVYKNAGFRVAALEEDGKRIPWWKDKDHPILIAELEHALSQGFGPQELCARLMVMDLESSLHRP